MIEDGLGPMPEPEVEPPAENPGVEDAIPEEVAAAEDKQQENEGDGASEPEKEDPA